MSEAKDYRQVATNMVKALRKSDAVVAVWYYGAAQRGRPWDGSDVDLLVLTEDPPVAQETRAERSGFVVHLHWIGRGEFDSQIRPEGDRILHSRIGGGELLYDRDGRMGELTEEVHRFPTSYQFYQLIPHLEALANWARDLRKRMAMHDERPRRAAARQWEVDNHAAAILLIEKGHYPHNEATTQAMDARIFVPNMADPDEIEAFIEPHVRERLLPQLQQWAQEGDLDSALLHQRYHLGDTTRLLEFAAQRGWLRPVKTNERSGHSIQETMYRPA